MCLEKTTKKCQRHQSGVATVTLEHCTKAFNTTGPKQIFTYYLKKLEFQET